LSTTNDKKTVLDPFGTTIIEDYDHLYEEFGIQPFRPLLSRVPDPSMYMRRNVVFGHRDFQRVLEAMKKHKDFAVMSGIKPTGEFHLGTLMTAREVIYFQNQGAKAFYCIADVEAYEDNKIPFERSQKYAVGNVADLLALGFNPKKGYIYQQSKERRVQDLAIIFGRGATLATMKAIYGERHIGLYLSALIQAGDILMPQLKDFDGPKPTVVPVGVDQDPHLRLTRDLAAKFRRKYNFIPPSSTVHKIMKGLDGSPKMSKRNTTSYFTLHDKPETIRKKISNAFTGGRPTVEEQRKLGGNPEICPVYQLDMYQFVEDDKKVIQVYHDCKSGKLLCGEHKNQTIETVLKFIKNHQLERRKFMDKAREILRSS
jgi:tryptophanyl-tRNA synthetase